METTVSSDSLINSKDRANLFRSSNDQQSDVMIQSLLSRYHGDIKTIINEVQTQNDLRRIRCVFNALITNLTPFLNIYEIGKFDTAILNHSIRPTWLEQKKIMHGATRLNTKLIKQYQWFSNRKVIFQNLIIDNYDSRHDSLSHHNCILFLLDQDLKDLTHITFKYFSSKLAIGNFELDIVSIFNIQFEIDRFPKLKNIGYERCVSFPANMTFSEQLNVVDCNNFQSFLTSSTSSKLKSLAVAFSRSFIRNCEDDPKVYKFTLGMISRHCPDLEKLCLRNILLGFDTGMDNQTSFTGGATEFADTCRNLKSIQFYNVFGLYNNFFQSIASTCEQIHTIIFGDYFNESNIDNSFWQFLEDKNNAVEISNETLQTLFKHLKHLKTFSFTCQISGYVITDLAFLNLSRYCPSLETFRFDHISITDAICLELGLLQHLKRVAFINNGFITDDGIMYLVGNYSSHSHDTKTNNDGIMTNISNLGSPVIDAVSLSATYTSTSTFNIASSISSTSSSSSVVNNTLLPSTSSQEILAPSDIAHSSVIHSDTCVKDDKKNSIILDSNRDDDDDVNVVSSKRQRLSPKTLAVSHSNEMMNDGIMTNIPNLVSPVIDAVSLSATSTSTSTVNIASSISSTSSSSSVVNSTLLPSTSSQEILAPSDIAHSSVIHSDTCVKDDKKNSIILDSNRDDDDDDDVNVVSSKRQRLSPKTLAVSDSNEKMNDGIMTNISNLVSPVIDAVSLSATSTSPSTVNITSSISSTSSSSSVVNSTLLPSTSSQEILAPSDIAHSSVIHSDTCVKDDKKNSIILDSNGDDDDVNVVSSKKQRLSRKASVSKTRSGKLYTVNSYSTTTDSSSIVIDTKSNIINKTIANHCKVHTSSANHNQTNLPQQLSPVPVIAPETIGNDNTNSNSNNIAIPDKVSIHNHPLEGIILEINPNKITEKSLRHIANHCPNLKDLKVVNNEKKYNFIDRSCWKLLIKKCLNLKNIQPRNCLPEIVKTELKQRNECGMSKRKNEFTQAAATSTLSSISTVCGKRKL